ncbi:MAG TPA: hypothetical protein PLG77_07330 [Burkholderiaceae bacterium]|nr:hypothetical protein [Burkholderiaceae bacterium]HRP28223.1 hypothetical protein [Burkholderiaceae bacterium]
MNGLLRTLGSAAASVLGVALLAACASSSTPQGLPLGSTEAQVIARMGPPTGRYKLDNGGTRLEFARGPQGRETYMVDFDASGGSTVWDQVLTPQHFISLEYGISSDEVLKRIGHPGSTKYYPRQGITVWNYRYPTHNCLWYQVSIASDGKFLGAAHTTDPECDTPTRM